MRKTLFDVLRLMGYNKPTNVLLHRNVFHRPQLQPGETLRKRGKLSRVASTETAFALREESYVTSIVAAWEGGSADRHIGWARACWSALEPFASSGVYVNFLGDEEEGRVRASYRGNYERLVALKNHYDPTNFFAYNQNIKPTPTEVSARPAYICTLP
ncbi:MAG TPA: BBE domain-containing protein [Ktedonobacteraceae bacterium]